MNGRKQFLTFFVRGLLFGIEVENVQEVLHYQKLTRVPLAPSVVCGLINLRGRILVAIDLGLRLELERRATHECPNVIFRTEDGLMSLVVDEIGDVVDAEEKTFEPPPGTLTHSSRLLIRGVHKLDKRLMHVLNVEALSNLPTEPQQPMP